MVVSELLHTKYTYLKQTILKEIHWEKTFNALRPFEIVREVCFKVDVHLIHFKMTFGSSPRDNKIMNVNC